MGKRKELLLLDSTMSYSNAVKYLLNKYGRVRGSYFLDEECRYKNRYISRSSEGLVIHHIDEYKYMNLCVPYIARQYPRECQERLVYCDYLEHLVLHLKLARKFYKENKDYCGVDEYWNFQDYCYNIILIRIRLICCSINKLYFESGGNSDMYSKIEKYYGTYVELLSKYLSECIICCPVKKYFGVSAESMIQRLAGYISMDNQKNKYRNLESELLKCVMNKIINR